MTRDERQAQCLEKWKALNGHGTIVASTGFGKGRIALNAIGMFQVRHPDIRVLIVVPTTLLRDQWEGLLKDRGLLTANVAVLVINTAVRRRIDCDLLILDEAHRYPADTFSKVFTTVKYYMIMCLTATFERLDGKHTLISKYAPVVDTVTLKECRENGWVSEFREYMVLVEALDMDVYDKLCNEFNKHFEFFDYDFKQAMAMVGPNGWKAREAFAQSVCKDQSLLPMVRKSVVNHSTKLMKALQARKKYVYEHPEKLRVVQEILSHRPDCKAVVFSATIDAAKRIPDSTVYTGKAKKKVLDKFNESPSGVLSVCKLGEEGLDIPDLSIGIMTGVNSSKTKHTQTRGRVIRFREGKKAEFFTLVMKDTVEAEWWAKSSEGDEVEVIDEENLMRVLEGLPYDTCEEKVKRFALRY